MSDQDRDLMVGLLAGALAFFYLFGVRYMLASVVVTLVCGYSGVYRWVVYKTNVALFVVATLMFAMPPDLRARVVAGFEALVDRLWSLVM
jgi:hypothetical protein